MNFDRILIEMNFTYFWWLLAILLNVGTIYYFVIRKKVFSPMTSKKWTIVCCTILLGFIFFIFLDVCGIRQQWLPQENLSNLKRQEGILKLTHSLKNNHYYIEMENGEILNLIFVYPYMPDFEKYESEYVTIWEKGGRYVYQMEIKEDIVFPINEANSNIFHYNLRGVIKDLMWLWGIIFMMFISMYSNSNERKSDFINENINKK